MATELEICEECSREIPGYDAVNFVAEEGSILLCSRCFSEEALQRLDIGRELPVFDDLVLSDHAGAPHTFHVSTFVAPVGFLLKALEIQEGQARGYEFQVLGRFEASIGELQAALIDRIERGLARQHLEVDEWGGLRLCEGVEVVRGRFTWDEDAQGEEPAVVVDGKDFSWEDLGRALSSLEGWQFRLEIKDPTEDLE